MKKQNHTDRAQQDTPDVVTVDMDDTVAVAAKEMQKYGIGCVVATDARGKLAGILTERDIIDYVVAASADPSRILVKDVMTTDVASCGANDSIHDAEQIMTEHSIRHLPMVENGVAVGMISSRDVMVYQLTVERAMKTSAERIARLFSSLRNLDFSEVVHMITHEVPALFRARQSVLLLPEECAEDETAPRITRNKC